VSGMRIDSGIAADEANKTRSEMAEHQRAEVADILGEALLALLRPRAALRPGRAGAKKVAPLNA